MASAPRTWEISDIDGRNKRTVTLAEYLAEVVAVKAVALAKFKADWGGLTPEQAVRAACDNAHLFKPAGGR